MERSLYVHIPFCVQKCLYCDFNSFTNNEFQNEYIDALINEIEWIKNKEFETIFIGGGTPTILSMLNLEKLLKKLSKFNAIEFSVESNPGTLDIEKLKLMKNYGVNRLSIGLQAWQNRLLKKLGRIHTIEDFLLSYDNAVKCGYNNINIDIMFGLPDQTFEDWSETVQRVIELKPRHVSAYSLIIEEGTPFYNMDEKGLLKTPGEDIERDMYHYAIDSFGTAGLRQYEISNFADDGFQCRHNITYWRDKEYIGIGAGAHSYRGSNRYSNKSGIGEYIKGIKNGQQIQDITPVTRDDEMEEFMFLGLRLMEGIDKKSFEERFNEKIESVYGQEIEALISDGLILSQGNTIKLTSKGVDLSNQVFVRFLK